MFRKKSKIISQLKESFGKLKNEEFNFDLITKYFEVSKKEHFQISNRTYDDLDMDEFFMFADRTVSKPGQQFLYRKLRSYDSKNV